jgi:hypothetical protein
MLVALLVAVSGYFLGRQVQELRHLRRFPESEEEDRRLRRQTYRRLVTSGLLLLLGFMLAVAMLYLETPAQRLADESDVQKALGKEPQLTEAQRDFRNLYRWFWIAFLLILMTILFLAAFDLWATRRHGVRELRRIQADRRAMLDEQIKRLRHERNGHG